MENPLSDQRVREQIGYLDFDPPMVLMLEEQKKQIPVDCSSQTRRYLDGTAMTLIGLILLIISLAGLLILLWRTG